MHRFKVQNFKSMACVYLHCVILCRGRCLHRPVALTVMDAHGNHAVGTPVLGRPNLAHFDGICVITILSPLGSACIGRLGRGVPTDSIGHFSLSKKATPRAPLQRGAWCGAPSICPPLKGRFTNRPCRQCVSRKATPHTPLQRGAWCGAPSICPPLFEGGRRKAPGGCFFSSLFFIL